MSSKKQFFAAVSLALVASFVLLMGANKNADTKQQESKVSEFFRSTSPIYSAISSSQKPVEPAKEDEGVLKRIKSGIVQAWESLTGSRAQEKESHEYYADAIVDPNSDRVVSYDYYGSTHTKRHNDPHGRHEYYVYDKPSHHKSYNYYGNDHDLKDNVSHKD